MAQAEARINRSVTCKMVRLLNPSKCEWGGYRLTIDTGNNQQVLFTRQPDGNFIRAR
ncbi:hypothetical protein ACLK17_26510 [Escherichia coli]